MRYPASARQHRAEIPGECGRLRELSPMRSMIPPYSSLTNQRALLLRRRCLLRNNELPDFRALAFQFCDVLLAYFLIYVELFLREILFAGSNISLAQPITRVHQVGIVLQRLGVFGDRFSVFLLVRVEVSQLLVGIEIGRASCRERV